METTEESPIMKPWESCGVAKTKINSYFDRRRMNVKGNVVGPFIKGIDKNLSVFRKTSPGIIFYENTQRFYKMQAKILIRNLIF